MQTSKLLQLAETKGLFVDIDKRKKSYRLSLPERTEIINDILAHDATTLHYTDSYILIIIVLICNKHVNTIFHNFQYNYENYLSF